MMQQQQLLKLLQNSNIPKLKATFAGQSNKRELKKSKCVLPISVGQQYHEDEKMKATLYDIQEFGECDIVICDTLYEHTKTIGRETIALEGLHQECLADGKAWLARNQNALNQLTITHRIIHWDEWRNHKNFADKKKVIDSLYEDNNKKFKSALNKTANEFLSHYMSRNPEVEFNAHHFQSCVTYLKEECAVMLLWAECDYHFLIYPAKCTDVLSFLYKNVIVESNPGKLEYLVIKIQERNILEQETKKENKPLQNSNSIPKQDGPNTYSNNCYNFHHNKAAVMESKLTNFCYGIIKAIVESSIRLEEKSVLISSTIKSFSELTSANAALVSPDDFSPL